MISLENITGDTAVARNFQTLTRLVPDTYGLSLMFRAVSGGLTSAGAVNYGVGFTSSRTALGTYVVAFSRPFPGPYVILLGSDQGVALSESFWSAQTVNGFTFNVRNGAAATLDAFVNFLAVAVG